MIKIISILRFVFFVVLLMRFEWYRNADKLLQCGFSFYLIQFVEQLFSVYSPINLRQYLWWIVLQNFIHHKFIHDAYKYNIYVLCSTARIAYMPIYVLLIVDFTKYSSSLFPSQALPLLLLHTSIRHVVINWRK